MSQKKPADILGQMSKTEMVAWHRNCILMASGGLATLRRRSGNKALAYDKIDEVISEAYLLMEDDEIREFASNDEFNFYFYKLMFQAINRIHNDTRSDRGRKTVPLEDSVLSNLSMMSKDFLEDMVHDKEMHRRFRKLALAVLSKSDLRKSSKAYIERLPRYALEGFTVENIAEDLGCKANDVYQYRARAKKLFDFGDD